ncbi:MAG: SpoIIE family protein phosphatase [Oscillospiraceae bacterium]|nr:SpoIIE family protein phosphatase [Oscillospiraceae bacterium]
MAYEPMEVLPWTVVTVMDVAEALSPAAATRSGIEAMTARTVADVNHSIRGVTLAVIVVLALSVLAVVILSAVLAGRITRPLGRLLEGVGRISGGDLDAQITVETRDEIASLADAFNGMTGSLKKHIADLTAVTAEKERIGAELNVATDIQASMLPSIFPAFPERSEFDIYATMVPAKEVGGDFYDFFMVDDEHLGIVMADVSGKGVPAALFMVIAKTLIKNHAQNGEKPEDVFTNVNNQLCESNDAGMFVTGWMAVLNIRTGELTYANAGHNPPLLRRADGGFEYLHSTPGFVLAGLEGMQYTQSNLTLRSGDALYLYTDGVTEATDLNEQLYGEERLQAVLNANADASLSQLLAAVKADVDAFVGEAPQFDDITMLALRFTGDAAAI